MLKYKDRVLKSNVNIISSLKSIYGVGRTKALYLSTLFGFSEKINVLFLNHYFFGCMTYCMRKFYSLENRLLDLIKNIN